MCREVGHTRRSTGRNPLHQFLRGVQRSPFFGDLFSSSGKILEREGGKVGLPESAGKAEKLRVCWSEPGGARTHDLRIKSLKRPVFWSWPELSYVISHIHLHGSGQLRVFPNFPLFWRVMQHTCNTFWHFRGPCEEALRCSGYPTDPASRLWSVCLRLL